MSDVKSWSTTAASNNSASPDGFPEGMAPSGVNDSAREVMASVAKLYTDTSAITSFGGTANALTFTTSQTFAAYAAGMVIVGIATNANTGAATLNVNAIGAKTIKKFHDVDLAANDIESGAILVLAYRATEDVFQLLSASAAPYFRNATGQTAAPTVNDDSADGYSAGSLFVDTTNDNAFVCLDATAGAAIWRRINAKVIQANEGTAYSTYQNITTVIPTDDTVPQNTEGAAITSVTITPTSASSTLVIEALGIYGTVGSAGTSIVAVFQDSGASAIAVGASGGPAGGMTNPYIRHVMTAGTTSATTFSLRAGPSSAAVNFYINGNSSGRLFGGIGAARLRVTEYSA